MVFGFSLIIIAAFMPSEKSYKRITVAGAILFFFGSYFFFVTFIEKLDIAIKGKEGLVVPSIFLSAIALVYGERTFYKRQREHRQTLRSNPNHPIP
jgi:hypothetical protein